MSTVFAPASCSPRAKRVVARHDFVARVRRPVGPLVVTLLLGCGGGPARVQPPRIDPEGAAAAAMEAYDADRDGFIAGGELDAAPSLKASLETLDVDQDGKVVAQEIADRIVAWQRGRTGVTVVRCYVTLDGQPLEDAEVVFEPEPFLGEELRAAVGTTALDGSASPIIPKENRPSADMPPGIQLGFFKIRVSKKVNGVETLPAKYNAETTLGQQIAGDDPAILRHRIDVKLSKR